MNKKIINYIFIIILLSFSSLGFKDISKVDNNLNKPSINDDFKYIAINQILMWVSNNGDGSHDPKTDGNGFYWPGGKNATKSAIFEDGLIWAGLVNREVRMNGNTHRQGLQAGKILPNGKADDPSLAKYRVYKIRKGWESLPPGNERSAYEKDYNEWPIEDGAPYETLEDGTKVPKFEGDEVLWYVANDLDASRSTRTYGSQPIGLEFQTTIFGFNRTGPLGDMVFKKYKIINKGGNYIDSMYIGYWSDTDLGNADDDYTGCDTILSLGYTYNAKNSDAIYGSPPPAVGYDFFQGPVIPYDTAAYPIINLKNLPDSAKFDGKWIKGKTNLPMTAFTFYINSSSVYSDPTQGNYNGSIQFYRYLRGFIHTGLPFIDPHTGQTTKFVLSGDPVAQTGWYEGKGFPNGPDPGDRRHLMCSGPFEMAPGDTQEVVVGILIAVGSSNLNSVTMLKVSDLAAQKAYDLDFVLTDPPPSPEITAVGLDRRVSFYWKDNAESYDAIDKLIVGRGFEDSTYTFEGYEIYQYRDLAGTDPVLLATYDIENNNIAQILDYQTVLGQNVLLPVVFGTDNGLRRYFEITTDVYTQKQLRNGTPYYIGVVPYGYCPFSSPKVLKSTHLPIEVIPQKPSISTEYYYQNNTFINVQQNSGKSDVLVLAKVIDPNKLTGDKYEVSFNLVSGNRVWSLKNITKDTILLKNQSLFLSYSDLNPSAGANEATITDAIAKNNYIIDGFIIGIADPSIDNPTSIREISLIKDGGVDVKPVGLNLLFIPRKGVNVFGRGATTSQRGWYIEAIEKGASPESQLKFLNWGGAAGKSDYEIRFLSDSSEFYVAADVFGQRIQNNNPKSPKAKLPLQFWDIGDVDNPNDDMRLYIKVFEGVMSGKRDSLWTSTIISKHPVNRDSIQYEELYFMRPIDSIYQTPIPNMSGTSTNNRYPIGKLTLMSKSANDFPKPGTVLRIITWKPIQNDDVFEFIATKPKIDDITVGKANIDNIGVFPNPYFGTHSIERDKYQRFVRFNNLPREVTIRIYSLSGVFINRIDKDESSPYADWDLRNQEGIPVASGIYIAHLEMPGIGSKILKIAVIMETPYIDRL